jgi:CRP/FNR family transcriptional regulator
MRQDLPIALKQVSDINPAHRRNTRMSATSQTSSCRNCLMKLHCQSGNPYTGTSGYSGGITVQPSALQRGEYLYRQGDSMQYLYVIRSGSIKLLFNSWDGEEQIINFYMRGQTLGLGDIQSALHGSSAVALETTSVCKLNYDKLQSLCKKNPDLYNRLIKLVSGEVYHEQTKMLMHGQKQAEERLASFILEIASRNKNNGYSFNAFNLPMSRHDIANFLWVADETISRLITKFCDDKLLEINKRSVRITDYDSLLDKAGIQPNSQPACVKQFN